MVSKNISLVRKRISPSIYSQQTQTESAYPLIDGGTTAMKQNPYLPFSKVFNFTICAKACLILTVWNY